MVRIDERPARLDLRYARGEEDTDTGKRTEGEDESMKLHGPSMSKSAARVEAANPQPSTSVRWCDVICVHLCDLWAATELCLSASGIS